MSNYTKHLKTVYDDRNQIIYPELASLTKFVSKGAKGNQVKLIQEWLCLNGFLTSVDGQFGPATEACVKQFQEKKKFQSDGTINNATFEALVSPMIASLKSFQVQGRTFAQLVHDVAFWRHLSVHPRELGNNMGPWVRLYMGPGGEGYPWCAGFVTFVMYQVSTCSRMPTTIIGSWGCDELAAQAKAQGIFIPGASKDVFLKLKPGDIFLIRKSQPDWTHTGFVHKAFKGYIETIEGNTNDEGSREGYEVCLRRRGYKNIDFISL